MKPRNVFLLIWLFPLGLWVLENVFLQYLRWSNTDCIVHGGFARGCFFFGSDISERAYDIFMNASWGFVFFTLPYTIVVGVLGLILMWIKGVRDRSAKKGE